MAATNVQALVLVYDIRGFTAASRLVGTADLGAVATAAHRQILDLFGAAARRDERLRLEFRRARVGLKGLGSTLIWVKRPFSWTRMLRPALPWIASLILGLGYLALVDAGLRLPFSTPVRRFLDSRSV